MTTNDLVKRLREETEYWGPLLREAADEIERLREKINDLKKECKALERECDSWYDDAMHRND